MWDYINGFFSLLACHSICINTQGDSMSALPRKSPTIILNYYHIKGDKKLLRVQRNLTTCKCYKLEQIGWYAMLRVKQWIFYIWVFRVRIPMHYRHKNFIWGLLKWNISNFSFISIGKSTKYIFLWVLNLPFFKV